jgi:Tfp pilus assembly protein PilF
MVATATASAAQPYAPARDEEVLEVLPRTLLGSGDELAALRRRLAENPRDADVAFEAAQRYIAMGNASGDPRFFGYARAAIGPWQEAAALPLQILRLRAKLKEKEHLYDQASADLQQLLREDPRDAQAWIELANIYRVQGRYEEAQAACQSLSAFAGDVATTLCSAPIQAATGEAEQANASLGRIMPAAKSQFPSAVQWILTMQAQIAQALGRDEQAERHFREGLANDPDDSYLLRGYGDFLLDHQRDEEALALLRDHTLDNGILLRAAIAARRSGQSEAAAQWQAQLKNRFDEIRLRGGQPHGRFEARYELELNDNPQRALQVALANWEQQKEERDTRNVLEAAIAANQPDAARSVLEFVATHKVQNATLLHLARRLEQD